MLGNDFRIPTTLSNYLLLLSHVNGKMSPTQEILASNTQGMPLSFRVR
uniref:Uncharacterized protein n=1 Tax=Nelumbo nucifera TaxID=4432 RepID=A0A822XDN0_NELNU|nr:TPA_asm: hypothetical protein HUJ06_019236 [Nelumbo nucifera]DAD19843.1 TPA_asm: hypothetical protein HUJ06_021306 [Nelumbo nucifera]